jgi:hypothetical protein
LGSKFIAPETFDALLNESFSLAGMAVMHQPPKDMPSSEAVNFANGLVIEYILDALKKFSGQEHAQSIGEFYEKCKSTSNPVFKQALSNCYDELAKESQVFKGIKYSDDVLLLRRMKGSA